MNAYNALTKEITAFLMKEAFFMYAFCFFSPSISTYKTVSIVSKEAVPCLDKLFDEYNRLCYEDNRLSFVSKIILAERVFYVGEFGLINVSDVKISEGMFFDSCGFKFLFPEESKKLVKRTDVHCTNSTMWAVGEFSKEIILEIFKKREIALKEEQEEKELFKRKIEDFKKWFLSLAPNLEELSKELAEFDIFYSFSDDIDVCREGAAKEKSFIKAMKDMGVEDTDAVFQALHKAKSKQ